MRAVFAFLAASAMLAAPAVADPVVKASMPAIRASLADGEVVVRLDQGVLGSARSLSPRTIVMLGHDASGKVIAETTTIQNDPETRPGKRKLCGYFKELALLITTRKLSA